jgi:transcriptional regulator with XRE-family HTH domain
MKLQLRKEIGIRMRKIRKTLGYTQAHMVSFFDIGRANYSRIEKGEIFPTATTLNTLLKEFNVSLNWLISNEGEMFLEKKKPGLKNRAFGKYIEEINDLLLHLEKIPMVRHAVLGFFMEYKMNNQGILQEILEQNSAQDDQDNDEPA